MSRVGDSSPAGPIRPGGENSPLRGAGKEVVPKDVGSFRSVSAAGPQPAREATQKILTSLQDAKSKGCEGADLARVAIDTELDRCFGTLAPQRIRESIAQTLTQDPAFLALLERATR